MKTETSIPVGGPWNEVALEVLKRCVTQGVEACNPGVSILAVKLTRTAATPQDSQT